MKYYFYSCLLIIFSALAITTLWFIIREGEERLVSSEAQIPLNSARVAGVQKFISPPKEKGILNPYVSARAVLIKDLNSETILFGQNANTPLPIASTTKIMTALVANEYFKPNSSLRVKNASSVGGAKIGLFSGEILSFRSLLYGMLLPSGNDAAYTIAENYPGGINGFVQDMNKKASQLKLSNTHFDNPAGFDSPNHYSSAADLAKVTEEALKDPQLSRIFATKDTEIISLDKKYTHKLFNLNRLLSKVSGVLGVKTGYTENAKENLVSFVERDGKKILVVVLGSDDRFLESTNLIEWTYSNFEW